MKKIITVIVAAASLCFGMVACSSDAKVASENLSKAADNFEVQRKIVGVNTRTDKYLFYVEGRCSVEREDKWLVVTCKHAENDYRKHYVSAFADTSLAITQEGPVDVSVYHTRIIIKPENLLPNLELSTGRQ